MRISQWISGALDCSRKKADSFIKTKQVTVNGEIANFGMKIANTDRIEVAGELILNDVEKVYIMLNKPIGITCTGAEDVADNIIKYIDYPERIFPVGRLDKASEGLILLTNDGVLANQLLQSEFKEEKVYHVTVDQVITVEFLKGLQKGVSVYNPRKKEHVITDSCKVEQIDEHRFAITLTQGLNRQIRRMCRYFDYTVTRLDRVQFKQLVLDDLPRGEWRHLNELEIKELKKPRL